MEDIFDSTSCWQGSLQIALAPFEEKRRSVQDLNRITGKKPDQWTWPTETFLWLIHSGYEMKLIEEFDFQQFAQDGKKYLIERFGETLAKAQEDNSDLNQAQEMAKKFLPYLHQVLQLRLPTLRDIQSLRDEGYQIIVGLNSYRLYGQPGYAGHFVVPVEVQREWVVLFDPGISQEKPVTLKRENFEAAWAYPTERERNLVAIRKSGKIANYLKQFNS